MSSSTQLVEIARCFLGGRNGIEIAEALVDGKERRRPSLSVQKGACSRSAGKPVARKWRSSTSAYRAASARSAASSGSQTRSVSHSPRVHPEAPLHRFVHPLDLLHAIRPRQREHRLIEAGEENLDLALRCERSQPVEVGGLVASSHFEQGPRGAARSAESHGRRADQQGGTSSTCWANTWSKLPTGWWTWSQMRSDRRHVRRTPALWTLAGHGHGGISGEDVVATVQLLGGRLRLGEARFGAGKECGEQGLRGVAMLEADAPRSPLRHRSR